MQREQGKFNMSHTCQQRQLKLAQASGDKMVEATALGHLGNTLMFQDKFAESLEKHDQGIGLLHEHIEDLTSALMRPKSHDALLHKQQVAVRNNNQTIS